MILHQPSGLDELDLFLGSFNFFTVNAQSLTEFLSCLVDKCLDFSGLLLFGLWLLLEFLGCFSLLPPEFFNGSVCLLLGLLFRNDLESKIFCELKVSPHLLVDLNDVF